MFKPSRFVTSTVIACALPLLLLSIVPGTAIAESQRKVAVFGIGPDHAPLLNAPVPPAGTEVWIDTIDKTFIEGWTEYNPSTCTDISTGTFTTTTAPKHGTLFFDIESGTLSNGDCPGVTFPFNVARYTWTDASQKVLQDPFALEWTTPDGMFKEDNSFIGELAKITQAASIWWACSATTTSLATTGTLTLNNPPSGATSFVWTITAGATELNFSNNMSTITTTTGSAGITSLAKSAAMNDISINVVVSGLTYLFATNVRAPNQLKSRPDKSSDTGRGANCNVTGDQGYLSSIAYEVDDQFGTNTAKPDNANAGINEFLGKPIDSQKNNWAPGPNAAGGSGTSGGLFADRVCVTTNRFMPNPEVPQNPLTNNLVDQIPQTWFAGSSMKPPPNQGCEVQTDTINRYIDHGRHVNIVSPPPLQPEVASQKSSSDATSYPGPVLNVRYLAEESAEIVKGRVLDVDETGTIEKQAGDSLVTSHKMTASFQVDSVLKGKVEAKVISIDFFLEPGVPSVTLEQNEYVLLFLKNAQTGSYTFADPQVGKMAITSRNVPLAEAVQTPAGKLEAELFASLSDPDSEVVRAGLEQVGNLESVRSTLAIRDAATSRVPEFQGLAHIALLRLRDYSLLNRAIRFAEQPDQDPDVQHVQFGVAEAIGDIEDRSVLPTLNSLLASPNVSLRRAAAKALRTVGGPSSARLLVRALDDKDVDVQYDAVMALAALVGATRDNAPAREVFNLDPARYLGNWKSWWETSGKQRYESGR